MFSFSTLSHDETYHLFGYFCVPMHTNSLKIFCFSCQGKSRDIVYQRICLFLWLIFAQHGLFEIQLTVYSALSRLTDLGIYDITRCGIWLLTIFHIPYIHFQRELRKVHHQNDTFLFLFSILPRMNVLLVFICIEPVELPGTLQQLYDRDTKLGLYRIRSGLYGSFATGVEYAGNAYPSRHLVPSNFELS